MTLTEESSYIPSITGAKDDRDIDQHWDINDNILPIVSLKITYFHVIEIKVMHVNDHGSSAVKIAASHCQLKNNFAFQNNMSLVTRKPVFGVSDQLKLKPACSATETY